MYKLESSYGKSTFDVWCKARSSDLRGTRTDTAAADCNVWPVETFRELVERVAFLGSMNKRLTLFYRGQRRDVAPSPVIFRQEWTCFDSDEQLTIGAARPRYWDELQRIGHDVYEICRTEKFGLPRWRGLRDTREVQWAVVQHYQLWPTPLLDLTSSLRAAASFAMGLEAGRSNAPRTGFVYVVGMPHSTGSISYDLDEQLVLARLQSACPPIAKRPHYQDGFLVGRFPIYELTDSHARKSSLINRLVAKFKLSDAGSFWTDDPVMGEPALLPLDDPLLERFRAEFGSAAEGSLRARALTASGVAL
jgi:FRG domain